MSSPRARATVSSRIFGVKFNTALQYCLSSSNPTVVPAKGSYVSQDAAFLIQSCDRPFDPRANDEVVYSRLDRGEIGSMTF